MSAASEREQGRSGQAGEGSEGPGTGIGSSSSNTSGAPKDQAKFRQKKRVGFPQFKDQFTEESNPFADEEDTPPGSARSTGETRGKRDSIDTEELTNVLRQIITSEEQRQLPIFVPEQHLPPAKPRSALRKPRDLQRNPDAVGTPEEQVHRSEIAAKHRADLLATDLSAAGSRRESLETPDLESSRGAEPDWSGRLGTLAESAYVGRDGGGRRSSAPDSMRRGSEVLDPEAQDLESPMLKSGQVTPVAGDLEYIPKPDRYRSGILSNLIKLYNNGEQSSPRYSSAPTTANTTPRGSPPTSTPGTPITGGGGARPRSGLFGLRNHGGSSNSVTTLSGLISSSASLAGPGSSNIAEVMSEKAKHDKHHESVRSPKSNKMKQAAKQSRLEEKIRIKVHIAHTISRQKYLVKLCRALMLYGAPTHRLEGYMAMSARVLQIEGQFLYLPGCMIISFDDSKTHTTEVQIVRAGQGVDLGRLHDVHRIYKEVVHDLIGVEEATQRLDEVIHRRDKFNNWIRIPMSGLASACVAPFAFEGRFIDLPVIFVLGCILGTLQLVFASRNELYSNVFEITAAIITSFLSRALGSVRGGTLFCFSAMAQSSIALILPGYMVLCSSLELQTHNIIPGSVRMVYAMIYTLFLGYGITIGSVLYGYIDRHATSSVHCTDPLNVHVYWKLLFVCLFTLCLCVLNQAKWKQMPVMLVISICGYCASSFSSAYFRGNTQVSNTLGALTIGVLANLYARVGRHVENFCLDLWELKIQPRYFQRRKNKDRGMYMLGPYGDSESGESNAAAQKPPQPHRARQVGYGLAAAAMLPAIFVQVPGGIASGGSLFSGVQSADQITGNSTVVSTDPVAQSSDALHGIAFSVLFTVIQVAIGISVGLSLSALIVYPLGKRRSGLFSF